MRIFYNHGICLQEGIKEISLDPNKQVPGSIVSHAHMDHLTKEALMTPETLSVMRIRLGSSKGKQMSTGESCEYNGFKVKFHEAGHTFGSVMVEVGGILYTGDFNPEGGLTCGHARPVKIETLIIESTYGKPQFTFPSKRMVENDILSWTEAELEKAPVAFGAVEFGKAQELIALLNRLDTEVAVADIIASIADVYVTHGQGLKFRRISELSANERKENRIYIVPKNWISSHDPKQLSFLKENGGSQVIISGWCQFFNFKDGHNLTAQFPLSDHADFNHLIDFASSCEPDRIYTIGSHAQELASELGGRLGIPAESLQKRRRRTRESSQ